MTDKRRKEIRDACMIAKGQSDNLLGGGRAGKTLYKLLTGLIGIITEMDDEITRLKNEQQNTHENRLLNKDL